MLDGYDFGRHFIELSPSLESFTEPLVSIGESQEAKRDSLSDRLYDSFGLAKSSFDIFQLLKLVLLAHLLLLHRVVLRVTNRITVRGRVVWLSLKDIPSCRLLNVLLGVGAVFVSWWRQ